MNFSDMTSHGAPSGFKAIGTLKWTPGKSIKAYNARDMRGRHEVEFTPETERVDYLVETNEHSLVLVNHGIKPSRVMWDAVDAAEVWYW